MYRSIRWQQRFQNFEKAALRLSEAVTRYQKTPSDLLILEGLVQTYEFTYELAINTTRDFLMHSGHADLNGSRNVLKQALQDQIITDGHSWIQAVEDRNLTSHTYDEKIAKAVVEKICSTYAPLIQELYQFFKHQYEKSPL